MPCACATAALCANAGNDFASEALPDALPQGQNSPAQCPYGLYAEQLSGTAFTAPRSHNQRSWLYRIRPSVVHEPFHAMDFPNQCLLADSSKCTITPNQLRWRAFPVPERPVDFVRGLFTMCCAGNTSMKDGYAVHIYTASTSMKDCCLANADGDFLIVPQEGALSSLGAPVVITSALVTLAMSSCRSRHTVCHTVRHAGSS